MRISLLRPALFTLLFAATLLTVPFFAGTVLADDSTEDTRETVEIETNAHDPAAAGCTGDDCNLVRDYGVPIMNFLGAIVGIVVTISIVTGGIQYASSADDPQKVAAAKKRITNSIIALIAYLFLFGFLQWLVPGGFFRQ